MPHTITHPTLGGLPYRVDAMMATWNYGILASAGLVDGHSFARQFGYNGAVTTAKRFISNFDAAGPFMPIDPATLEVVSDSAADDELGVGAQKVFVQGLDANWDQQHETVVMDGLAPVVLTKSFIRVRTVAVIAMGTHNGSNVGSILLREAGGGTTALRIDAAHGLSTAAHYSVPRGFKLFAQHYAVHGTTVKAKASLHIELRIIPGQDKTEPPFGASQVFLNVDTEGAPVVGVFDTPAAITPMSDVFSLAHTSTDGGTVFHEFSGALITTQA